MTDLPSWITAISTAAVGTTAIVAIVFNVLLVRTVRRQTTAAIAQAEASDREAKASREMVDELQRDRGLAHMPYLVFRPHAKNPAILKVRNIGRGPALDCRFVRAEGSQWTLTGSLALGAGEDVYIFRAGMAGSPPGDVFVGDNLADEDIAFCKDQFGYTYRFLRGGAVYERWPKIVRPEWTAVWSYQVENASEMIAVGATAG